MGMIRGFITIWLMIKYINLNKTEGYVIERYLALTQLGNLDKRGFLYKMGKAMAELWKTDT